MMNSCTDYQIIDYKRSQFRQMVAEADLNLSGNCPLIEDEAIVWAGERIQKLEGIEAVIDGYFELTGGYPDNDFWSNDFLKALEMVRNKK